MSHTVVARARKLEVDFSLAKTERRKKPSFCSTNHIIMDRVFRLNSVFAMVIIQSVQSSRLTKCSHLVFEIPFTSSRVAV